jgi:hypothetical protein
MGFIIIRLIIHTENINNIFKNPPNKSLLCIMKLIPIKTTIHISVAKIKYLDLIMFTSKKHPTLIT